MDTEIDNFIKKNTKKQYRKKTTKNNTKKNTNSKKIQKGENSSKIIFDDKYNPLKFTDNILLFADGKQSSEIINTKEFDKYSVNISSGGTVYISLVPKKMNMSYEEYKKQKDSAK